MTDRQYCGKYRMLTHDGKTMCVKDWAETIGIPAKVIHDRLSYNWDVARALTKPHRPQKREARDD